MFSLYLLALLLSPPCISSQENLFGNLMGNLFGNQGGGGNLFGNSGNQGGFFGQNMAQGGGQQGMSNWRDALAGVGSMVGSMVHKFTEGKTDILHDLKNMNGKPADWNAKSGMICARYPGLPQCQSGQILDFNQLGATLQNILKDPGKFLPKVPFLNIKDPLAGINRELSQIAKATNLDLGAISQLITSSLLSVCKWVNCHAQTPDTIQFKNLVMKRLYNFEQNQLGRDNTVNINLRADRTQQIKQVVDNNEPDEEILQALLEKAGLGEAVTAADNGVFDKDILLTEAQQHFLLNELGKGGVGANTGQPTKRASIYFQEQPNKHWNLPIPYTFDSSLEEYDKNDVREALREIEQKTCIRFNYSPNPRGNHINYQKVDSASFCGLSYVGRTDPANPVYLSFQCGNAKGIAIHETLHALGIAHQHLRPDRDQHISIDWSNVNPQHYDMFAVVDPKLFTSYGVRYTYDSIMHYNAYTGAVNIARPTMIPKVNPSANLGLLGQRNGLSSSDVEMLNKMYCSNGCSDANVYCGAWALSNLCQSNTWVANNCRKSCNFCSNG